MVLHRSIIVLLIFFSTIQVKANFILLPMDESTQQNHLKAYGITYWALNKDYKASWLLNYRGGSFLLPDVTEIRKETNEVVLGIEKDLDRQGMWVGKLNLQKYEQIEGKMPATTKVRYKHEGSSSIIEQIEPDKMEVFFHEPVSAIAPGQAAVFYEGNDLIGGGWILKSLK